MSDDEVDYFDFRNEIDKASWELLAPHKKSESLFLVDSKLDLNTVALAMAKDKVSVLKIWLDNGDIRKINDEDEAKWKKDPKADIAEFLIVQPYVIMRLLD